ncbi:LytR C-terminal domain-containing protein [Myceligenerans salitolerans]|uniref:LytR C-terminal domain-containing protein n=1 Tax=Myceligenerans salitolerans TaxID=1230528 RepID=A0ABS3IEX9_9MICO|nr:LytR C-terminal domain-containing protein [Myceligenerans salitolerans]MBO0610949.1 LytR C-terminal domain-containing protein [Myceligenerans salitolerans]
MTNSTYRYPPDEFDVAVPGGAPVGVHRAPRSGWSSAWPFLLVALVCAGVAWGGITLLSGGGNEGNSAAEPTASVSPGPSASASGAADGEGGGQNEGEGGEGGNEPSGEPSDAAGGGDALPGDPALADLTVTIGVYNDGAGSGMAGTTATNLQAAGFSGEIHPLDAGAANGPAAGSVTANTVLYGGDRADTASAVADALGISGANVQESADVAAHPTEGVWVILVTPPGA